jgi:hypothetical protein
MSDSGKPDRGALASAMVGAGVVAILLGGLAFGVVTYAQVKAQTSASQVTAARPRPVFALRKPLPPAKVQWSSALRQIATQNQNAKTQTLAGAFAAKLQKPALDQIRLPVILPRNGAAISAAKAKLLSFGDAYALNLPQDQGVQITVYGNRSFVPADAGAISRRPMQRLLNVAENVAVEQTEDGWTATFERYGVVYTLDVSCDDIKSPACASDAYLRNAVASFSDVTLGAQAQAEASAAAPQPSLLDKLNQNISKLVKGN